LRQHDAVWLATINLLGSGLILLAASGLWDLATSQPEGLYLPPSREKLLWIALFGISQMAIPYVLFGLGMREVGPQEAGILTLLEPVLVPLWTYLSVDERPSLPTFIGGGIVILMVLVRYLPTLFARPERSRSL
jgi:drug/metabolite transporter (DMT)-like permease